MSDTNACGQCGNCGHVFSSDNPYFSHEFAAYFCPKPLFSLTWCLDCTHVSVHEHPGPITALPTSVLKFTRHFPLEHLSSEPYRDVRHPEMGGPAAGHLMRMAWHALNARVTRDTGKDDPEAAMRLAVGIMPSEAVAWMVAMTVGASSIPEFIPLVQQIQEGLYLGDKLSLGVDPYRQWIKSSGRHEDYVNAVLARLDAMMGESPRTSASVDAEGDEAKDGKRRSALATGSSVRGGSAHISTTLPASVLDGIESDVLATMKWHRAFILFPARTATVVALHSRPEDPRCIVKCCAAYVLWERSNKRLGTRIDLLIRLAFALKAQSRSDSVSDVLSLLRMYFDEFVATCERDGDTERAIVAERDALALHQEVAGILDPGTRHCLSQLKSRYRKHGMSAKAIDLCEQEVMRRSTDLGHAARDTLIAGNDWAEEVLESGDLLKAIGLHRAVLHARREAFGDEDPDTLISCCNLAIAYGLLGQYDRATELLEHVLARRLASLGRDHERTVKSYGDLANAYLHTGRIHEASEMLLAVLGFQRRRLGRRHHATIVTAVNCAHLLFACYQYETASDMLKVVCRDAIDVFGRSDPHTLIAMSTHAYAELQLGRRASAVQMLQEVQRLAEERHGICHPFSVRTVGHLALAFVLSGDLPAAEPLLVRGLEGIESLRGQAQAGLERAQMAGALSLDDVAALLGLVRIKLGRVASLVFDASSVVDAIERGTSRAILDLVQPMSFEWGNLAAERHARGHWSKQELEHFTDVSRRANELQERLNNPSLPAEARKQLGEELTELRKDLLPLERELLPASSPRSLDQIRSVLRPGELVLLYSWASMAVTLVAIPAPGEGDVTCVILDEDKDRIQQAERAAKTCADGLSGRQKISEMLAAAKDFMSFAFPDSVRAVAARAERLVIIPSGPLHNVPVDVLAEIAEVPEVTDPQVVYAPSASIFAMLRERGQVNGPYDPTIVGDPDLRLAPDKSEPGQQRHTEDDPLGAVLQDTDRWKLKQLPHAGLEARRIAELFALRAGSEVKPLLGPDATVPAVHGHARGKRFLHLATHGQLAGPSDPMGSAIVLSKSKEANEPERFDPAPTTYDKLRLDTLLGWTGHLDGCELVTLSACQTSQGVRTGDSTMALPIGFFHAGARCVLASQWKVADDATGWLMERMYEGLLGLHDEERVVGGRRYPPGQQMPLPDALKEARTWLRNMTLGERNRRVKRAGMLNPAAHRAPAQTPATAAEPKTGSAEDPFDGPAESRPFHDTPYYWAAFVIVGDAGSNGR
jgi:CHAT domain-containing protein/tetratricopeptide (TPR) repeat protein